VLKYIQLTTEKLQHIRILTMTKLNQVWDSAGWGWASEEFTEIFTLGIDDPTD